MLRSLKYTNSNTPVRLDMPTRCPHCLDSGSPDIIATHSTSVSDNAQILKCVNCNNVFFATYYGQMRRTVLPNLKPIFDIPYEIKKYYPDFFEVYEQAATAESASLNHIAGMGYRKAVEYLVKYFMIDCIPDEKEAIEKETLGKTIERIDSSRIKSLAKASTWLGNDQTHLLTKHPDYNVEDLKKFINALCYYIISEKTVDEACNLLK